MHDHNARVMRGEPITDAELDAHNRIKSAKGDLDDIYQAPAERLEAEPEGLESIY